MCPPSGFTIRDGARRRLPDFFRSPLETDASVVYNAVSVVGG